MVRAELAPTDFSCMNAVLTELTIPDHSFSCITAASTELTILDYSFFKSRIINQDNHNHPDLLNSNIIP